MNPRKKSHFVFCSIVVIMVAFILLLSHPPAAMAVTNGELDCPSADELMPDTTNEEHPKTVKNEDKGLSSISSCQLAHIQKLTAEELADIIEKMEREDIVDISIGYKQYIVPKSHHDGIREKPHCDTVKFKAAELLPKDDPNVMNWDCPGQFLLEKTITKEGEPNSVINYSFNGETGKRFFDEGPNSKNGMIEPKKPPVYGTSTPFRFTPLEFAYSTESIPLHERLLSTSLRRKGLVRIDRTVRDDAVEGFRTISADLLTSWTLDDGSRLVYAKVYFSVDHGFTPVMIELMRGHDIVALSIVVKSLEQVADGVWFPSSGYTEDPDSGQKHKYEATGPIVVNQGLTKSDFDIVFPDGTDIEDRTSFSHKLRSLLWPPIENFLLKSDRSTIFICLFLFLLSIYFIVLGPRAIYRKMKGGSQ